MDVLQLIDGADVSSDKEIHVCRAGDGVVQFNPSPIYDLSDFTPTEYLGAYYVESDFTENLGPDRSRLPEGLMHVGTAKIILELPENGSLKGKRRVIASLMKRVRNKFNVSIAEVDFNDSWQQAALGLSAVSNSARHADEVIANVVAYIESTVEEGYVSGVEREVLSGF